MFDLAISSRRRYTTSNLIIPPGWRHVEASLDAANVARVFINGVLREQAVVPFAVAPGTGPIFISRYRIEDSNNLIANFQNFRLTRGASVRHTASFVPSYMDFGASNDPRWSDVKIALPFTGADDSTVFTDLAGGVWTAGGAAKLDNAFSLLGSTSLSVVAGAYARRDYSADTALSVPWTIDFWIHQSAYGSSGILTCFGQVNSVHSGEVMAIEANGAITLSLNSAGWPTHDQLNLTTDGP